MRFRLGVSLFKAAFGIVPLAMETPPFLADSSQRWAREKKTRSASKELFPGILETILLENHTKNGAFVAGKIIYKLGKWSFCGWEDHRIFHGNVPGIVGNVLIIIV